MKENALFPGRQRRMDYPSWVTTERWVCAHSFCRDEGGDDAVEVFDAFVEGVERNALVGVMSAGSILLSERKRQQTIGLNVAQAQVCRISGFRRHHGNNRN